MFELNNQLLLLPTGQLLEKFGAGNHVPGSGSAAALSGILACKLCFAVIRLTEQKPAYENIHSKLAFINKKLQKLEPKLYRAFQRDSEVFDELIGLRRKRDAALDKKEKTSLAKKALRKQKEATQIPLEICIVCHEICKDALTIFEIAFKSARGDSGAAVSCAISGAYAALFICYLNLKDYKQSRWSVTIKEKCEELLLKTTELQKELFSKVIDLKNEGFQLDSTQLELDLVEWRR